MAVAALTGTLLTHRVESNATLVGSISAAAWLLVAWTLLIALRRSQPCLYTVVVRRQHWIQALVQGSVYLYWGWFFRPVYDHLWLLFAQLCFAYTFDILLAWSRRKNYVLGFGAFPIVFSTNLFLWFRDDWFYLQFVMIAVGLLGKEFVRWNRPDADGALKNTHIFNPSAFTLALFSLALIVTGTTDLTWGREIASTLTLAPNIYTFLFVVGLVVMYFFAITPVTGAAAATLIGLSALYYAINGVPYFLDSEIPAAVFLGLHLLVTDPSTSPRSVRGKFIFGMLYGGGVFFLYWLLSAVGAPTFYDKLLCVPLLNLSVIAIDRLVANIKLPTFLPVANPAHMLIWMTFFVGMTALGKTDGKHTGDSLPFWETACAQQKSRACERLLQLKTTYCNDGSTWSCNELGAHYRKGDIVAADEARAKELFARSCELRGMVGCQNLLRGAVRRDRPREFDLRLLLREGGRNLFDMPATDLYARACDHGWKFACASSGGARQ